MAAGWREQWAFAVAVWRNFLAHRGPLAGAGIAFYLTLSMIPLLLLLLSVASYLVGPKEVRAITHQATALFGIGVGEALRLQVLSVVEHRGVLTGVSLLLGFWAGSQVFAIMQMALNEVWGVPERRAFWVQRGLALLMVAVTGVLAALAVILAHLLTLARTMLPGVHDVFWLVSVVLKGLLPLSLITLAFAIIYHVLPARIVPWRYALPGAVVAGVLWTLILLFFSWYTGNFARYDVLYGSLGGLVLLLLWFNYSTQVLLIGAEVAALRQQGSAVI
jgi:membrane protein